MYPQAYALYPYLSPRQMPLTINQHHTFRVRRVDEWLTAGFRDFGKSEGLAEGEDRIFSEDE